MTPAQVYRIVTMAMKDNGTPSIETLRELERMQREEEELDIRRCRECSGSGSGCRERSGRGA